MPTRALRLAVPALVLLIPRPSLADDTHYHDFPLGARAVGLGGAFTAIADDPSGLFYNPAGLVDVKQTSVEISTNLYGVELLNADLLASLVNLDSVFAEINVIPTTAGLVKALGEADSAGRYETAYGFGAFAPSFRNINIQTISTIAPRSFGGCVRLAYQRSLLDRTFWFGAGVAQRLGPKIRIGMASMVSYRTLLDHEESACFAAASSESLGRSAFASAATKLDLVAVSLLASFGVKAEISKDLFAGVSLMSPSIGFLNSATLRVTRGLSDPSTARSQFLLEDLPRLDADSKTGLSLRLGLAKVFPATATWVMDVSIHAPVTYRLVDIPRDRRDIEDALTLVNDVKRRLVVNVNFGAEWLVEKTWSIAGGLFTNVASSPPIPGDAGARFSADRLPHVNGFGGSLVLGLFTPYTLTRLGISASYGIGNDVVAQQDGLRALAEETSFIKASLRQMFLFFFLSSTLRLGSPPAEVQREASAMRDGQLGTPAGALDSSRADLPVESGLSD